MSRVLAMALLLVMAGPVSGPSAWGEVACEDDCGDFGGTGDCCACLCKTRSVTVPSCPLPEPATDDPVVRSALVAADEAPPDPEPAEILHVPKHAT